MATLEPRRALPSDASMLARLCLELGYDCTEFLMRQRLVRLRDDPEHAVFVVAAESGEIIGWLHAEVRKTLWGDPFVQIMGMVVRTLTRRRGVGRALIRHAEAWADSRGLEQVQASPQEHREDAHAFFEAMGYAPTEELQVWSRTVEDVDPGGTPTLVD